MGKRLVIKGADFSDSGIIAEHKIVTALIGGGSGSGFKSPFKFGAHSSAEIDFEITEIKNETVTLLGWYTQSTSLFIAANIYEGGGPVRYFAQSSSAKTLASSCTANQRYKIFVSREYAIFNDGARVEANVAPTGQEADVDFGLIGSISSLSAHPNFKDNLKVYSVKQWDNEGNLVVDALPCVKKDGTICLYNNVNGEYIFSGNGATLSYEE